MSGVLFTSAGLRESWRLSADFDPLSISNSQRWPSGPNDRVASSRRVSSPPRLTALPHLTSPSKAEISRTAYKRHAQSFGTLDELKEDDSSTYGSSSKYQEDRPTSSSFGSVKGALRAIYGKHDTEFESSDAPDEQSIQYPTGFRWFLILLSGALPYVVAVLDDTIIATIIPVLVNEFESPVEIGWYASAYFLTLTIFMPLFGKCYSLWPIKWLFFSSLIILGAGSITCAAAPSSTIFIAGRAVSGTGAAGIINGAMRIIGVSSPRKERSFLEAAGALFMGVCTAAGPVLGGVISVQFGWRWAFWINVPVAVGSLLVVLFFFPPEANQAALRHLSFSQKFMRLDPLGSTTLIGCLACLITALQLMSVSLEPLSPGEIRLLMAASILFGVFIVHESLIRPDLALIPRRLIAVRAVWSCCISLFLLFAGFMNFVFFLSIFFQTVLGESAQSSAVDLLPYVVAVSIAAFITAITVSWIRYYNPLFILGGICFSVGAGLVFMFEADTPLIKRILCEALMGMGVGFLMLANVAPCQTSLDEKDHAITNGLTFFCSLFGATISLPVSNLLFNRALVGNVLSIPDIPDVTKLLILSDPTQVNKLGLLPEQLVKAITALVDSIRTTFLLGLCFAVATAVTFWIVPWKPLMVEDDKSKSLDEKRSLYEQDEVLSIRVDKV